MSKERIHLLCADADRPALQPVLDALKTKGLRIMETAPEKDDITLAVLTGGFYADSGKTEALLALVAAGAENILPLQLDAAPIPDSIKNALYTRNIIPAAGRDAAHTAQRITDALPKKKSRLPLILSVAAVLLLSVVGLLLWRAKRPPEKDSVPVMAETSEEIYIPAGLTEEDLAAIEDVVIVGDYFAYYTDADFREAGELWPDANWVAYEGWDEEGSHWYSKEDGHEYAMTGYEDLRFLELMPKLRFLSLVNVEADSGVLPDLSGAALLEGVSLRRCNIDSLEWLRGAKLQSFDAQLTQIADYSPLSDCARLRSAWIDLYHAADLSAFAPPQLSYLRLENGMNYGETDLSGLAACSNLTRVELGTLSLRDLDFLENKPIHRLELWVMSELRDISAVGSLRWLEELEIKYCPGVTDYTPIAGCTALVKIHVQGDYNPDALRDASFLRDLPELREIHLYSCNLHDLDFLKGAPSRQGSIQLGFAGDIQDYSGLAAVRHYEYLHVNPRYHSGNRGGEFSAVLPYIQDADIDFLMLYECAGVDLSQLPDGIRDLSIRYGDLRDLSGLKPYDLRRLELWDCQYLSSLNGIETVPTLFGEQGQMELEIVGCPRLTDYTALSGSRLAHLKLVGQYALPDLGSFQTRVLGLESIPELRDLSLLDALSADEKIGIDLVGLDELQNLSPLRRLNGGHLIVPPQVAEQAEELVEEGVFDSCEVAYPDSGWQPFDGSVTLLSLDELDTLPKALLRRVERLCLVGDTLIDMEQGDIWEDWNGSDTPALLFHDWNTDEATPIQYGKGPISDLSVLAELTGLRELKLYAQPLEDLDGLQILSELDSFTAAYCPALTDASAAFACPELQSLGLFGSPVESIQGVQNLQKLRELDLNDTRVTDLSPLTQLDTSFAAEEHRGFRLFLSGTPVEDYAPLAAFGVLDNLDINNVEAALFIPYLDGVEVHRLSACCVFEREGETDGNALFADFVRSHPQLMELWIPWNPGLTDLTPVLELQGLEYLRVSADMKEAIASLDGKDISFTFEIEGQ